MSWTMFLDNDFDKKYPIIPPLHVFFAAFEQCRLWMHRMTDTCSVRSREPRAHTTHTVGASCVFGWRRALACSST